MKRRILICDDTDYVRKLFAKILASEGYEIQEWDRGQRLVEEALAFLPDLILLDVIMPGPSAPQNLEALRRQAALNSVPIILLSGCEGNPIVEECLRAGATCFLPKPVELDHLKAVVRGCLGRFEIASV